VIAIVSSVARERDAFSYLCEQRGWNTAQCPSVRAFRRLATRITPKVLLVRFQLEDGYSDDVIASIAAANAHSRAKIIVLLPATTPTSIEARQLEIGADCVQRDPIRSEVLLAYLAKYVESSPQQSVGPESPPIEFAGATLNILERTLKLGDDVVGLTPREVMLAELFIEAQGKVVTYDVLYSEILGRRFQGDTSNMRVLLGKLGASLERAGISMRDYVEVIPKTGYRYRSMIARLTLASSAGSRAQPR
jgi:DNA-binding response OmpR family regulator